jgi:hypothetical protein
LVLALVGCVQSHEGPLAEPEPEITDGTPPPTGTTSALIGPEGGHIAVGDLQLDIPAGALAEPVEIRVTVTTAAVPDSFDAYSPLYRFEPAGLTFALPVDVRLPFVGPTDLATIFWTRLEGDELIPRATEIVGTTARTTTRHFSRAFVGTACRSECCTRANGELDLLMVVDNSNSMSEEQASLAMQLPRVAEILATGDLDGDGVQDFPAVESLQVGVVTADMGTGGFSVPTCAESSFGDDGVLRTAGNTAIVGCDPSYPTVARYEADDPASDATRFAHDVGCVAVTGTGGCGFEQQLEAALKAVTPSTAPMSFAEDTRGHADGANAGLIRPTSVLTVLQVTDEDDCSASDPELFNPASSVYSGDLNLRCHLHPGAVHPVGRYVDGLLSLRGDPANVIFASIAGIPPGTGGASPDYAALLADPLMQEEIDPAMPTRLRPSCDVAGRGFAYPPRRLVETTRRIDERGGAGVLASICDEDFTPALDAILSRVSERLSGTCSE